MLNDLDISILIAYLVVSIGLMVYYSGKTKNIQQYFLANRSLPWYAVGFALFATDISSEHVVGLVGAGHSTGLAVSNFVLSACVILIILGWIFTPIYLKAGFYTLPQYLEKRFNASSRMILSIISIVAYVVSKVSVSLLAGGLLLHYVLGWDLYTAALVLVLGTGIYTLVGGSNGIMRGQVFQSIVMIVGFSLMTYYAFDALESKETLNARVPVDYFKIFKPASDSDFPWPGMVFGALILGVWYWTTDQYIAQMTLGARSVDDARTGSIFAALLRLLPIPLIVLPGILAKALYPDIPSSQAFLTLLMNLIPAGVRALVLVSVLAALVSSMSASFNATATLFTIDIYNKIYPRANDFILVNIGRIATFVMVILGVIWVPFIKALSSDIYNYIQSVQSYIAPPICVVFLLGVAWPRANGKGASSVLVFGLTMGAFKFLIDIMYKTFEVRGTFINFFAEINFLYYAIIIFVLSIIIMVTVSLLTDPPAEEKIYGLTLQHLDKLKHAESYKQDTKKWFRSDVIATAIVLSILVGYWIYFG